jgi:hypothetical protein
VALEAGPINSHPSRAALIGCLLSKRQVLRLLTSDVAAFAAEADGVLRAGLSSAPWITVDDTGARHRARNGVTTQIGNERFTYFGTTFSKSRKNFLELLRAGHRDYVVNAEANEHDGVQRNWREKV